MPSVNTCGAKREMLKYCDYCGTEFEAASKRRLYCCDDCRRKADNERKQDRRAEETELRAEFFMPDDWALGNIGEDVMQGALLDGWTSECELCADEAIAGPLACQQCPHWKASHKSKRKGSKIDLLCSMCRDGVKV